MRSFKVFAMAALLVVLLVGSVGPLRAQGDGTILTLAVPTYLEDRLTDDVLGQFEAQYGVTVELVTTGGGGFGMTFGGGGSSDVDAYLDEQAEAVTEGDVILISSSDITPEATRAGYYLDLAPLVNSDSTLNTGDYYPAVWESFQWDGGVWALPATVDAVLVFYNPQAFDDAGLPYPDTWRTFADMEFAIRSLTEYNPDGTVAQPGFRLMGSDVSWAMISSLEGGVYDDTVLPSVPRYQGAALEEVVTLWAGVLADGILNPVMSDDATTSFNMDSIPLQIGQSATSGFGRPGQDSDTMPSLLPGGKAGLVVDGYAVSAGTQYPELAYELAKWLTMSAEVSNSFMSGTPARQSLADNTTVQGEGAPPNMTNTDVDELLPVAIANGIPASDARFATYLTSAAQSMADEGVDVTTALQEQEATVLTRLDTASARQGTAQIIVETPLADVVLAPGEVMLNFGVNSFTNELSNQEQWDALVNDFVANDPEVGYVNLKVEDDSDLETLTEEYDCFYLTSNAVTDGDLSLLRSLDPLLSSDAAYDPSDMINGVMQQVQRDGQTWAMPLMIQPVVMRYNPTLFNNAGAFAPTTGWSVDEFEMALRTLKSYLGDDTPFQPQTVDTSYLLILIAAYGGLPFDYRTDPPIINFTDANTVEAIRQVLDLAKDGYFDYSAMIGSGGGVIAFRPNASDVALTTQTLTGRESMGFGGPGGEGGDGPPDGGPERTATEMLVTTFPTGAQYAATSFEVTAAYISSSTPYAEACYRFIDALAQSPELLTVMPARRSMINDSTVLTNQGEDNVAFYNYLDTLMQDANTIIVPAQTMGRGAAGASSLFNQYWFNQALDNYVNNDADLDVELADAQLYTDNYLACTANIPALEGGVTMEQQREVLMQYVECARQVDPSISSFFGG